MTTKEKIQQILREHGEMRPADLLNEVPISQVMLHRHIKDLVESGAIEKIGKSPKVFYRVIVDKRQVHNKEIIPIELQEVINKNFLHVTPTGKELVGIEAFVYWCQRRGFEVVKMAQQYAVVIAKYAQVRTAGLLDATSKVHNTFNTIGAKVCVDKVFYVDFYALETFGKTRLGQMLLYAKQSQDKAAIQHIADDIKAKVIGLLEQEKVDAVVFVPPTVRRTVQFMTVLEKRLGLPLPKVQVDKVLGDVAVPQKTLKSLEDRLENAQASFVLRTKTIKYSTVLIIDDAVGSGASINEIACKLKKASVAQRVIGLAVTGSLNNFDVISEV